MENVINKFNLPNSLLVITSYPNPNGHRYGHRDLNAVAWHSEKTLKNISKDRRVIVLAEKAHDEDQSFYANKNLYIKRVWSKTNHFSMLLIILEVLKLNYIKSVLVPFEFNVFGGTVHNIFFLFVLAFMRLLGKKVVIEVHQVIEDIKELEKHINITNPLLQKFFDAGLKAYYFLFGLLASDIIVFEQELKIRLAKYVDKDKIQVLSLATKKSKAVGKRSARTTLGLPAKDFLVMVFGYINGYKGIDFAIDSFSRSKIRNAKLVVAGGKNPYLRDKKFYQRFYKKIMKHAKMSGRVVTTGFVPDNKVASYFSAADLVALPYEVFMSASGPFSLALSYGKPVILSEKLIPYKESSDFKEGMKYTGLNTKDLFFKLKRESFMTLIKKTKNSKKQMRKLSLFSKKLSEKRDSGKLDFEYKKILFKNNNPTFLKAKKKELKFIYN